MCKKLVVFLFFLFSSAPIISQVCGFGLIGEVQENRIKVPFPNIDYRSINKDLINGYQKWFNDNHGLRSLLIRIKTQIDYTVFNTSDKVHLGSNGFMFYRNVMDRQKFDVENYLHDNIDSVYLGIKKLLLFLKKKNITLTIVINHLSDRFYQENLPYSIPRQILYPQIDALIDKLKLLDGLIFIDEYNILSKGKDKHQIFHKTDFHWNDPAACLVSEDIKRKLAEVEGKGSIIPTYSCDIREEKFSGGIAMFMPLIWPVYETSLFLNQTWPGLRGWKYQENLGPFLWVMKADDVRSDLLSPTVVVGDSFFDGIYRSGFANYFNEIRSGKKINLKDAIDAMPSNTKHLIIQFIEVSLGNLQQLKSFSNSQEFTLKEN